MLEHRKLNKIEKAMWLLLILVLVLAAIIEFVKHTNIRYHE
jgi:hypothetical protein